MFYSTVEESGILFITLTTKRATADVSREFKEFLVSEIDNNGRQKMVIDFAAVEFVDSSFLGAVVSGLKKITGVKGDIKILSLQPPVRAMFQLTRLYKVFEIFDNKQDAIQSF